MEILRSILSEPFFVILLGGTLTASIPIILAAIGESLVEKGGVLNLGLEGEMLIGAFVAFVIALNTRNLFWGLFSGIAAGLLVALAFGYLVIYLKVNQIVAGLGIWIFGIGITSLLFRVFFGRRFPIARGITSKTAIPYLSQIPYIRSVFNQHIVAYVALALIPLAWWLLYKTNFGLHIRAVGENPVAADAHGVNVYRTRYLTVMLEGILAGLAGAFLSICDLSFFVDNMTLGRGFIAIGIVMLANWNPSRIFYGAFLFGVFYSLTSGLQIAGVNVPREFLLMLPYVAVIVVLCIFARNTRLPAAFCLPYERE
ncbi:ABC transporter permease [Candidatus Aerophobetes bacterium]|nr:ABC transporter permease [Candidatus Aerophobetes bacterium]